MSKQALVVRPPVAVRISTVDSGISHAALLFLTAFTMAVYFAYSTASPGFYQHDEIGHFLGMQAFWHEPQSILGNWAKFGYKLLYVVPALGGATAVRLLNCSLAAGSCYLVARVVALRSQHLGLAAFCLAATQPLWVDLAFRNYSEIPTAFVLILAYYLHARGRPVLSMLCISYICTIRQEFLPIMGLYGLDLLRRKQGVAALAGLGFPVLQNGYGAWFTGDPLYLVHQLVAQSATTQDAYPRQGFGHYLLTCMVVFGPVAVTLLVHYAGWSALSRRLPDWYLVVPIGAYFLLHCLMNWQGTPVGPSNGGNLRYMLVIGPLVAVAGAYGLLATVNNNSKRLRAVCWLAPLLLVTGLYLNHTHNLISLTKEADTKPSLGVLMAGIGLLLAGTARLLNYVVAVVVVLTALMSVTPIKLSEEDQTMQDVARWFSHNEPLYGGHPVYANHALFFYWLGRSRFEFAPHARPFDQTAIEAAPKGSLFFWDSHYSKRLKSPKSVSYDYFTQRPTQFTFQEQLAGPSQTFVVLVFEKK